uniref:Uncharacterized protein n=1 Tax=Anguilla anguilla TaxID=7936 RepID=A0A0E9X944_ANGAN
MQTLRKAASTGFNHLHSTEACLCKGKVLIAVGFGGWGAQITLKTLILTSTRCAEEPPEFTNFLFWTFNLPMPITFTFMVFCGALKVHGQPLIVFSVHRVFLSLSFGVEEW